MSTDVRVFTCHGADMADCAELAALPEYLALELSREPGMITVIRRIAGVEHEEPFFR